MLSRANRLTLGVDYRSVVRRGTRCAGAHTVTHIMARSDDDVRFGFIVSKAVGNAVVRNTVRRRLKAVCHEALAELDPGRDVVIRALNVSADADFATLRAEVLRCLRRGRV